MAGMAWWSPPAMLTACSAAPSQIVRAAASEAPAISADASCTPLNAGLSMVPSPQPRSGAPETDTRLTAST